VHTTLADVSAGGRARVDDDDDESIIQDTILT
jgi:hypothetical protein